MRVVDVRIQARVTFQHVPQFVEIEQVAVHAVHAIGEKEDATMFAFEVAHPLL
jgi:hypothetical protein